MKHLIHALLHWLAVQTGTYIQPGQYSDHYNFWSGFGSDLTELALLAGVIGLYKHHNCAVPRCPRLARKHWQVKGTPLRTCHHHATAHWHKLLLKQYKEDYPEQHQLFNS